MSMVKAEEWLRKFNQEHYGMDEPTHNPFMLKLIRQIQYDAALCEKEDIRELVSTFSEE